MSWSSPAKALDGARIGHICDRCNKGVRTGDLVRAYATRYNRGGWMLRRVWCEECGETTIGEETEGADEVIVEGIFWDLRLVSVKERDRNR